MFPPRYRHRRRPFADPIDWTDYRWDTTAWGGRAPAPPWRHRRQGEFGFLKLLLAGLAVFATVRLVNSFRGNGGGSWARRGLYALLLVVAANVFANRSRRW